MKKMICKNLLLLVAICVLSPSSLGGQVTYTVGSYKFDVPKKNIPDLSPWGWFKSVAGVDDDVDSFVFQISGESIGSEVDGYVTEERSLDSKVTGAVYLVSDAERERISSSEEFADIWYSKNGYENREVILDEESGYYFVYEKEGYRGMFYVFSKPPTSDLPVSKEEFFVAVCSGSNLTELKHVSCVRQFLFKPDLMIEFSVSLRNLRVLPRVMASLEKRFSEWMR